MQITRFEPGHAPELVDEPRLFEQDESFHWFDIQRSEKDWYERVRPWLKKPIHERHIKDTFNDVHLPYYETTEDYDLLIVRALCPECPAEAPTTRAVAFIISDSVLVSVRPADDPVFGELQQRFQQAKRSAPTSVAMLLYLAIDEMSDTLLAQRDVTSELMSNWQDRLLDPNDAFNDWRAMMRLRSQLRRLEVISESEIDALGEWREQTQLNIDAGLAVRFNDLREHLRRLYNHSLVVQHDIDALIQIYFSSSTQRTNEILQFLAIISAIFLPLNLLAGIFGTNFEDLPLLSSWYGPWVMAAFMLLFVAGLLALFRKRRWI
ncbi:MAG: magnesium transporter CorA family protein [Gammaproteobacteria bacterium]|nr:magnesium transporter CorA family protein [Gammaproteobacteria bacterium]